MLWSTGNVALDQHLMPTMNKNSLIQIGGPEKGQCGMRAEASLNQNHHAAPAHLSLFSLPPKPQLKQELPYLYPELDASVGDVSLDTVGDVSLDTVGDVSLDEMKACSLASVDVGDSSLGRSGSQLTHDASLECEPSLLQPWKTLHHTADNSLGVCEPSRVYGGHVGEERTSDSRNSTTY